MKAACGFGPGTTLRWTIFHPLGDGFDAGFAGAAAGALAFAAEKAGHPLGQLEPYENEEAMVDDVKKVLGGSGKGLKAIVIGALGRCGRGAVDLFRKVGLEEYVHVCRTSVAKTNNMLITAQG